MGHPWAEGSIQAAGVAILGRSQQPAMNRQPAATARRAAEALRRIEAPH